MNVMFYCVRIISVGVFFSWYPIPFCLDYRVDKSTLPRSCPVAARLRPSDSIKSGHQSRSVSETSSLGPEGCTGTVNDRNTVSVTLLERLDTKGMDILPSLVRKIDQLSIR